MVFAGSASAAEATETKPDSPHVESDHRQPNDTDIENSQVVASEQNIPSQDPRLQDPRSPDPLPSAGAGVAAYDRADELRQDGFSEAERRSGLSALLEPSAPAANDDELIGGPFRGFGLRASWGPAIGVAVATAFWLFCILALYAEQTLSNSEVVIFGLGVTGIYAVLLLMIIVVGRSLEVQATTRNLAKVVAGLTNTDLVSANKVGSISEIVRGEMSSIDHSLDRTLARVESLEARLKTEYLDLERSFMTNDQQFRGFLDSLSTERAAIVTNAEKVRSAISGAHQNLSGDLDAASERFTRLIAEASVTLANTIEHKSAEMTVAATAASDKCVTRLDAALEGSIIRASDLVETRGDRFAALLSNKGNDLDEKLAARIKDASDLLERQIKDAQEKAAFRVDAMATQIHKLLKKMDNGIGERGEAINTMLANRTIDIARTLKETGNEFKQTLDRTASHTEDFVRKAQSVNQQLGMQIGRLSEDVVLPLESVTSALDEKGRLLTVTLADRFATIDNLLTSQSNRLATLLDREIQTLKMALDGSVDMIRSVLGGGSNDLKTSIADRAQKIEAILNERLTAFAALISENRNRLAFELSSHTQALDHMLDRQRALLTDLAEPRSLNAPLPPARPAPSERRSASIDLSGLPPKAREVLANRPDPALLRTSVLPSSYRETAATRPSPLEASATPVRSADPGPAALRAKTQEIAEPARVASPPASASLSPPPPAQAPAPQQEAPRKGPNGDRPNGSSNKTWLSDLLARASVDEDGSGQARKDPADKANYDDAPISSIAANVGNFIKPDELQSSWERYNTGGAGDFQNIYTPKGAVMQLKIKQRLGQDAELRQAVSSYVTEFERLLQEVHQDNGDDLIFEYLHTDAGKVYTMLAHASNRLGGAN